MSYNNKIIQTIHVYNESTCGKKLSITTAVDTLDMCTIHFGDDYTLRIPEEDVEALREALHLTSRELLIARYEKNPGIDCTSLRDAEDEEQRRDVTHRLIAGRWNPCN